MKRLTLYFVVVAVVLFIVRAIAPLIVLAVIGLLLVAWKRPAMVGRVTELPQLARLPVWLRATPMRFAGSVALAGFVAVGVTAPLGVVGSTDPSPTPRPMAEATPTPDPTDEPTQAPVDTPTPRPTRSAAPSPTPEPSPVFGEEPTGPTEAGTVVNVVDGDTIDVMVDGIEVRVRYIGMDTPETRSGVEWIGPEASAANAALVDGQDVILEKDVSETDQYGRALRYVWVTDGDGWMLVNLQLIRLGFASVTTYPPDVKYVDDLYVPAQDEAQAKGIGIWGTPPTPEPTPVPPPPPPAPPAPDPTQPGGSGCHPSYLGYCLTIGTGDWDCASGSGNGPNYLPVTVQVIGYDEFDLDRDGDGLGCEA